MKPTPPVPLLRLQSIAMLWPGSAPIDARAATGTPTAWPPEPMGHLLTHYLARLQAGVPTGAAIVDVLGFETAPSLDSVSGARYDIEALPARPACRQDQSFFASEKCGRRANPKFDFGLFFTERRPHRSEGPPNHAMLRSGGRGEISGLTPLHYSS